MRKITTSNLFLFGIFVIIASSLFVMQSISQNSSTFSSYYLYLLIFNITLAIILLLVVIIHLVKTVKRVYQKAAGSRLQLKLSGMLIFVTLTPLVIFFIFAINMINRGIEDWFDVPVNRVFQDSQELSSAVITIDYNNKLRQINQVAEFLTQNESTDILATVLERQREKIQAIELSLFNNEKSLIAAANPGLNFLSSTPNNTIFDYVRGGNPIVNTISLNDKKVIQVLTKLPTNRPLFLYGIFSISDDILKLSERINQASVEYEKLISLRKPLQESLAINLLLGLLLALFGAIVVAFRLTERFIAPITQLAKATAQIGEGDFSVKLDESKNDELGFLVRAFKIMANKIQTSNAEITVSKSLIEERNLYLQDLLTNMSSGVLCINSDNILVDSNKAAEDILEINFSNLKNQSIKIIADEYLYLQKMVDLIHLEAKPKSIQFEIKSENEQTPRSIVCKIKEQIQYGKKVYLLIFDDVTEIMESQRDSAWSEVAKRMAHEIKNPLTPIQLSAERIYRKYSKLLNEEDKAGLSNMTSTINKQVSTIKKMVEDFIQYGKNPKLAQKLVDINQLLTEVSDFYCVNNQIKINCKLEKNCKVFGDEDRLRQLSNNLIKNSIEAIDNQKNQHTELTGVIDLITEKNEKSIRVIFKDNGGGIDYAILDKIFVPYVSSKPKGTGLGMAIVKKIIEEHNAKILIKNIENPLGAQIVIDFPNHKE